MICEKGVTMKFTTLFHQARNVAGPLLKSNITLDTQKQVHKSTQFKIDVSQCWKDTWGVCHEAGMSWQL